MRPSDSLIVGWDLRVARTAALGTLISFGIVLLVTALSDEGGVAWGERLVRSLGALPLAAGVGAWLALEARRRRGEIDALATLGRSPARSGLAATAGALLMATVLVSLAVGRAGSNVGAFFPNARGDVSSTFRFESGGFVENETGLRIEKDGAFALKQEPVSALDQSPRGAVDGTRGAPRLTVASTLLVAALALALLGARPLAKARVADAFVIVLTVALAVWAFHAIAAGLAPLVAAILPMIALFSHAFVRYREAG